VTPGGQREGSNADWRLERKKFRVKGRWSKGRRLERFYCASRAQGCGALPQKVFEIN
jgi:hypothetical protein